MDEICYGNWNLELCFDWGGGSAKRVRKYTSAPALDEGCMQCVCVYQGEQDDHDVLHEWVL